MSYILLLKKKIVPMIAHLCKDCNTLDKNTLANYFDKDMRKSKGQRRRCPHKRKSIATGVARTVAALIASATAAKDK